MSIPLDRLYNYLESLIQEDTLIYRFYPHGSKKLEDLKPLNAYLEKSWITRMTLPMVFVHDQEPLNFDQYAWQDLPEIKQTQVPKNPAAESINHIMYANGPGHNMYQHFFEYLNIRMTVSGTWQNLHDYSILVHSEKNSDNVELYCQKYFLPVYWWCHAVVARDWFRYAEHDSELGINLNHIKKDFLIYNRAWTGTREYRLKFVELLIENQLLEFSKISFSSIDGKCHYKDHQFKNANFKISRYDFENQIPPNTADSNASADYVAQDYQQTAIEIVLETLFDDNRNHLTEKTLRPIACGRPFILTATVGSLKYLQSYGFQTFSGLIDESYDSITDPLLRLQAITAEMCRISSLPAEQKQQLFEKLYEIADYNKKLFFSTNWQNSIVDEFKNNFKSAVEQVKQQRNGKWLLSVREFGRSYPELYQAHQRDLPTRSLKELHTVLGMINGNKY
jgi:hypothetical protein